MAGVLGDGGDRRLGAWVVLREEVVRESWRNARPGRQGNLQLKLCRPLLEDRGVALAAPVIDEQAIEQEFLARRSFHEFVEEPVPLADLGLFLACLRRLQLPGHLLPKYRYGSAGSLYPVQLYIWVAEGRVVGLAGGFYYYHPGAHVLASVVPGAHIDPSVHARRHVVPRWTMPKLSRLDLRQILAIPRGAVPMGKILAPLLPPLRGSAA